MNSGETADADQKTLTSLAARIANRRMRGRTGFGGLSQRRQVLARTLELIHSSQFCRMSTRVPLGPWERFPSHHWRYYIEEVGGSPYCLIGEELSAPSRFDPSPVWALFWAMLEAEAKFHEVFVPYWSHEERLTGHLVSQIIERIDEFAPNWISLAAPEPQNRDSVGMSLAYFDTATARREALTGADLGLIVHGNFGSGEFFKVARFQAKKVNAKGKCRLDLSQVGPLTSTENIGHYLFYHFADATRGTPTPTVCRAGEFTSILEEARKERKTPREDLGEKVVDVSGKGWDFASFLAFGLADPQSNLGVFAGTPADAVHHVMQGAAQTPSRIAVLTLGGGAGPGWEDLLGEAIGVHDERLGD